MPLPLMPLHVPGHWWRCFLLRLKAKTERNVQNPGAKVKMISRKQKNREKGFTVNMAA